MIVLEFLGGAMEHFTAVILAAGEETHEVKNTKVLHKIWTPMLAHVIQAARQAGAEKSL